MRWLKSLKKLAWLEKAIFLVDAADEGDAGDAADLAAPAARAAASLSISRAMRSAADWYRAGGRREMGTDCAFMPRLWHEFGKGVSLANASWLKTLNIFRLPLNFFLEVGKTAVGQRRQDQISKFSKLTKLWRKKDDGWWRGIRLEFPRGRNRW